MREGGRRIFGLVEIGLVFLDEATREKGLHNESRSHWISYRAVITRAKPYRRLGTRFPCCSIISRVTLRRRSIVRRLTSVHCCSQYMRQSRSTYFRVLVPKRHETRFHINTMLYAAFINVYIYMLLYSTRIVERRRNNNKMASTCGYYTSPWLLRQHLSPYFLLCVVVLFFS